MRIEKIHVERVYNLGNYESIRLGADVSLDESDNIQDAYLLARDEIKEAYKSVTTIQRKPEVASLTQPEPLPTDAPKEKTTGKSIKDDIQSCKELKVLESYKLIAKSNPDLQEAYRSMEEKLKKEHNK